MFVITEDNCVGAYTSRPEEILPKTSYLFDTRNAFALFIESQPGERAVEIWNNLPGVEPIKASAHEAARHRKPKFRSRAVAVERIWNKLAELYPDAILEADMPKKKVKRAAKDAKPKTTRAERKRSVETRAATGGRKSAWAEELTDALRKRFTPGDEFGLDAIYKMVPQFERRHPGNKHVAARLRTTLAQDLRGKVVKSISKGKYRMMAA